MIRIIRNSNQTLTLKLTLTLTLILTLLTLLTPKGTGLDLGLKDVVLEHASLVKPQN